MRPGPRRRRAERAGRHCRRRPAGRLRRKAAAVPVPAGCKAPSSVRVAEADAIASPQRASSLRTSSVPPPSRHAAARCAASRPGPGGLVSTRSSAMRSTVSPSRAVPMRPGGKVAPATDRSSEVAGWAPSPDSPMRSDAEPISAVPSGVSTRSRRASAATASRGSASARRGRATSQAFRHDGQHRAVDAQVVASWHLQNEAVRPCRADAQHYRLGVPCRAAWHEVGTGVQARLRHREGGGERPAAALRRAMRHLPALGTAEGGPGREALGQPVDYSVPKQRVAGSEDGGDQDGGEQ